MTVHFADNYLLNPQHKITVNLIGLGGTGSEVLKGLIRINEALHALGHPGLHVYAYDADTVSLANKGRQLYFPSDIGINKAIVQMTRVNRSFGYEWEAMPVFYTGAAKANIIITCIDTAAGRLDIGKELYKADKNRQGQTEQPYYWLDFGNLQKTGQVVLGTLTRIKQPDSKYATTSTLPDVIEMFPQLKKIKEKDQGPSCSVAQALNRQDLFINPTLAQLGCGILWKLFRDGMINNHGCYLNLETLAVNPIKIK